ncbi:MAG: hypothetical protein ACLP9L_24860 [Thermoguttaceae bacterium]
MKVDKVFVQTAGAIAIMLASVTARAQDVRKESSIVSRITVTEPPAPPTASKQKTVSTAAHPLAAAAADGVINMGKLEMVTERYADGKVKIEREVSQDTAGNYINQGTFKLYAPTGEVIKTGEFLNGKRQGKWSQQFAKDEGHLFSASQDKPWSGPFTSEATFQDGRLHGAWTIKDSHNQSVVEWCFDNGTPSGTWTWWHPNGQKRLEATFVNGALNGDVLEWDRDGKTVNQNTYIDGKCVVKTVGWYTLGRKRYEGTYLRASNMPEATYDWWNSTITMSANVPAVADQQHGLWTEWYPSGNKKTAGEYDRGVAVGKITWWYENGQEQAEGEFEAGQKNGTWITWHPNGLKESLAEYKAGKPASKSLAWSADGKLVESHEGQEPNIPRVARRASWTR